MSQLLFLDANIFIQGGRRYAKDVFPGLWEGLERELLSGEMVCSVIPVYDEIKEGNDWLVPWVKRVKKGFLSIKDKETQQLYQKIADWVVEKYQLTQNTRRFLDGADPWLIAKAMVMGATVVTYETSKESKINIPDVCRHFNCEYISGPEVMVELMRRLNLRF
ncbi:MAG: DUF4411 family protein [Deltaproteobacteria bacterium]|nr:DUF4411 family protein [Deltaproteobacteria bacterium]